MIGTDKTDKKITIKYTYGGINQYEDFYLKNDKVVFKNFNPSWCKPEDVPSLEGLETIEEILEVIKKFSFCGRAEIYLINDTFPEVYENRKDLSETKQKVSKFLEKVYYDYFIETIAPILDKNGWKFTRSHIGKPIICKIDENGELDNIKNEKDEHIINMLCNDFLNEVLDIRNECNLKSETGYIHIDGFVEFYNKLNESILEKEGYYIENK